MNEEWTFRGKLITCEMGQLWQRKKKKGYLIEEDFSILLKLN